MNTWTGGRLVELDEAECWELLRTQALGRVGYDDGRGPVIVPLNFQAADGCIRIRTSPHSALGLRVKDRHVAFEVDHVDQEARTGWSVLVRGLASLADVDLDGDRDGPDAWPAGPKPLIVEIDAEQVSGRRLVAT
jgi:hypothetical protein